VFARQLIKEPKWRERPAAAVGERLLAGKHSVWLVRQGQMMLPRLKKVWQIIAGTRLPLRRRNSPAIAPRTKAATAV
jgi:hypothetical protein